MFENHPEIFILSVSSLEVKLLYLRDKLKIDVDVVNRIYPWLLTKNYNGVIRPRGELIIKYALDQNREQFEVSDEEFCKKNNINLEILVAEKARPANTNEHDYRRKFFSS